ncbi:MAG: hypothetical protein ACE5GC_02435 [Acidimicrobiia bacterium]
MRVVTRSPAARELVSALGYQAETATAAGPYVVVAAGAWPAAGEQPPDTPPRRVVEYDPTRLEDILEGAIVIGAAIGDKREGLALASHLRRRLGFIARATEGVHRPAVALGGIATAANARPWWDEVVEAAGGTPTTNVATAEFVVVLGGAENEAEASESLDIGGSPVALAIDGMLSDVAGPGLVKVVEALAWALHRLHPDVRPAPGIMHVLTPSGWRDAAL